MAETLDHASALKEHETNLRDASPFNKAAVFEVLATAGISKVLVTFNGEGDSGQIEEMDADGKSLPVVSLKTKHAVWATGTLELTETILEDAIETICYNFLSDEYGGWENNDGAYGDFTFDVQKRTIELQFNGRYTDVHTSFHTL
jgi:hypothetical protein